MSNGRWRRWAVVAATMFTLMMNGLANALPFNGLTTGEVSGRLRVFFVPAGYVLSIWGLIYIGLIAYTIYQVLPAQRENLRLRRVAIPVVVASVANGLWLLAWHYEQFALSVALMLVLLAALLVTYLGLRAGAAKVSAAETWLARVPFSIYLGWVSVATIANITSALDYYGWAGWAIGPEGWALIMLAATVVLAALMAWLRCDAAYGLVIVWALAGIGIKQMAASELVGAASWFAAGLTIGLLALGLAICRRRPDQSQPEAQP